MNKSINIFNFVKNFYKKEFFEKTKNFYINIAILFRY